MTDDEPLSSDVDPWVSARASDLSPRSKAILRLLDQIGPCETAELRDALPDVDDTDAVNYQVREYLEHDDRRSLAMQFKPERDSGGTPPNVISITPAGEQVVAWIQEVEEPNDLTIADRLHRIETLVDGLQSRMDRLDELEARIDALEDRVDEQPRRRGSRRTDAREFDKR